MRPSRLVHVIAAALVLASIAVWYATGAEGYTRWPDERLANADAPPAAGEGDLLAEIGFVDARSPPPRPDIHSRFALGLVPGGFDPPHLVAVATVAGAALIASIVATILGCCHRCLASASASRTRPMENIR